ncbi:hypothetical protein BGZ97_010105, partial [Linnemannia gamsii]
PLSPRMVIPTTVDDRMCLTCSTIKQRSTTAGLCHTTFGWQPSTTPISMSRYVLRSLRGNICTSTSI